MRAARYARRHNLLMPRSAVSDLPALAIFGALINATIWGLSWYPLRWLEARGVPALWATWFIFSACMASVLIVRPGSVKLLWQHRRTLSWLVLASGMTNACFNTALATGDVVRAVLLFYLMPMWVVLLARWLLAERITPAALGRTALALIGAALVLGNGELQLPIPNSWADWLAVAGGFFFGLNNVILRKYSDTPQEARALGMFSGAVIIAPLVIAALALVGTPLALAPEPVAWVGIALFAAFVLVGNLALQYGAARLPANVLSTLMLAEILVATLSSWLGGTGTITHSTLIGGAFIVSASALAIVSSSTAQNSH
jgi:drug/metabolite transporter (DMT)-like permease